MEPVLQSGTLIPTLKISMLRPRKFKELETKLGHRFKNVPLLERALTHASVRGGKIERSDNERLEFIGDRVLGLAIAEGLNQ